MMPTYILPYSYLGLPHSYLNSHLLSPSLTFSQVPSLLSLPYLGFLPPTDPTYLRTRKYVLSNTTNPWFFRGSVAEGVGGPHSNGEGWIWPMAIAMRALTSESDTEIADALRMLKAAAKDTGLMHESFDANNAGSFTRPWFSCAQRRLESC